MNSPLLTNVHYDLFGCFRSQKGPRSKILRWPRLTWQLQSIAKFRQITEGLVRGVTPPLSFIKVFQVFFKGLSHHHEKKLDILHAQKRFDFRVGLN